jgi:hypothetical protein
VHTYHPHHWSLVFAGQQCVCVCVTLCSSYVRTVPELSCCMAVWAAGCQCFTQRLLYMHDMIYGRTYTVLCQTL